MGYSADVVSGYGYRINTCDLEYGGDPEGKLKSWEEIAYRADIPGYPSLMVLSTGDSRAPMGNQGYILVFKDSMHEGQSWKPSEMKMKIMQDAIEKLNLHTDEGPDYFEDTYVL